MKTKAAGASEQIDDNALDFAGSRISEAVFDKCVVRAIRTLSGQGEFSPRRTAAQSGLNDSYLRRLQKGTRRIGLFTLFKLASGTKHTASQIAELIEDELRREISK